jgi:hypothetical protein
LDPKRLFLISLRVFLKKEREKEGKGLVAFLFDFDIMGAEMAFQFRIYISINI